MLVSDIELPVLLELHWLFLAPDIIFSVKFMVEINVWKPESELLLSYIEKKTGFVGMIMLGPSCEKFKINRGESNGWWIEWSTHKQEVGMEKIYKEKRKWWSGRRQVGARCIYHHVEQVMTVWISLRPVFSLSLSIWVCVCIWYIYLAKWNCWNFTLFCAASESTLLFTIDHFLFLWALSKPHPAWDVTCGNHQRRNFHSRFQDLFLFNHISENVFTQVKILLLSPHSSLILHKINIILISF